MNSFDILHGEWRIFLAFISIFICSYLIGQIFFAVKKEVALKWGRVIVLQFVFPLDYTSEQIQQFNKEEWLI